MLIQCRIGVCYRITLEILIEGLRLIPVDIGDHDAIDRSVPWYANSSRGGRLETWSAGLSIGGHGQPHPQR